MFVLNFQNLSVNAVKAIQNNDSIITNEIIGDEERSVAFFLIMQRIIIMNY